jgi:hypothetical protein
MQEGLLSSRHRVAREEIYIQNSFTQRAPARHALDTLTCDTDSAFLVEKSVVGPNV